MYDYKIGHIKEIIKENFNFETVMNENLIENHQLKMENLKLEEAIRRKDQEYLEELGNIENNCKLYIEKKEEEIMELKSHYEGSSNSV